MNVKTIKTVIQGAKLFLGKNSPVILTGLAVAGVVATVYFAVKDTLKAEEIISTENAKREEADESVMTKKEVVKKCWKCYLPTFLAAASTIVCAIASNRILTGRNAALASALALSTKALEEYRDKIDPEKLGEIHSKLAQGKLDSVPWDESTVVHTGHGEQLFRESFTGKLFRSSVEAVDRAFNMANADLVNGQYVSLGDLCYFLGLEVGDVGDMFAWTIEKGIFMREFSSIVAHPESGKPEACLDIGYSVKPRYQYA